MPDEAQSASEEIDAIIADLPEWKADVLSRMRDLILAADPDVVEDVKWKKPSNPAGVPTWTHDGILCTGEAFTDKVKITFAKGASLQDPDGLFNGSLGGNTMRAIDIFEGDEVDADAFTSLVRAAVAHNQS